MRKKNTLNDNIGIEKGLGSEKGIIAYMADGFDEPITQKPKLKREFGGLKGLVTYIADDFDAPMGDFKDYM